MSLTLGCRVYLTRPAHASRQLTPTDERFDQAGVVTRLGASSNGGWFEICMDMPPRKLEYRRRGALKIIDPEDEEPEQAERLREEALLITQGQNAVAVAAAAAKTAAGAGAEQGGEGGASSLVAAKLTQRDRQRIRERERERQRAVIKKSQVHEGKKGGNSGAAFKATSRSLNLSSSSAYVPSASRPASQRAAARNRPSYHSGDDDDYEEELTDSQPGEEGEGEGEGEEDQLDVLRSASNSETYEDEDGEEVAQQTEYLQRIAPLPRMAVNMPTHMPYSSPHPHAPAPTHAGQKRKSASPVSSVQPGSKRAATMVGAAPIADALLFLCQSATPSAPSRIVKPVPRPTSKSAASSRPDSISLEQQQQPLSPCPVSLSRGSSTCHSPSLPASSLSSFSPMSTASTLTMASTPSLAMYKGAHFMPHSALHMHPAATPAPAAALTNTHFIHTNPALLYQSLPHKSPLMYMQHAAPQQHQQMQQQQQQQLHQQLQQQQQQLAHHQQHQQQLHLAHLQQQHLYQQQQAAMMQQQQQAQAQAQHHQSAMPSSPNSSQFYLPQHQLQQDNMQHMQQQAQAQAQAQAHLHLQQRQQQQQQQHAHLQLQQQHLQHLQQQQQQLAAAQLAPVVL